MTIQENEDVKTNILLRIHEGLKFDNNSSIDLYRIMVPYLGVFKRT